VADGNGDGQVKVTAISAGGVPTSISINAPGTGYQMVAGSHTTSYGGAGTGLTVAANVHYTSVWRAKCSAALGTAGSTGGVGALLGTGIYNEGYLLIEPIHTPWEAVKIHDNLDIGDFIFAAGHLHCWHHSAQSMVYTDLVVDATDNTKVTSAEHTFLYPNNYLRITGGAGFTIQTVKILSVSGGVAHCDAPLGTVGSTGGQATSPGGFFFDAVPFMRLDPADWATIQILGDVRLFDGTYHRSIDVGSIGLAGVTLVDPWGNITGHSFWLNPTTEVIDEHNVARFASIYATTYGGGGYEVGAAVGAVESAVAGKVDKITVAAHTMTIPKLTTLGAAGSISWNTQGQVTSWVDPT
jgi:hypothetical protein